MSVRLPRSRDPCDPRVASSPHGSPIALSFGKLAPAILLKSTVRQNSRPANVNTPQSIGMEIFTNPKESMRPYFKVELTFLPVRVDKGGGGGEGGSPERTHRLTAKVSLIKNRGHRVDVANELKVALQKANMAVPDKIFPDEKLVHESGFICGDMDASWYSWSSPTSSDLSNDELNKAAATLDLRNVATYIFSYVGFTDLDQGKQAAFQPVMVLPEDYLTSPHFKKNDSTEPLQELTDNATLHFSMKGMRFQYVIDKYNKSEQKSGIHQQTLSLLVYATEDKPEEEAEKAGELEAKPQGATEGKPEAKPQGATEGKPEEEAEKAGELEAKPQGATEGGVPVGQIQ